MKTCSQCGQILPNQKRRRTCADCGRPVLRHDKWFFDGSTIHHKDCQNPTGFVDPQEQEQGSLIPQESAI